ncbi:MAG TPA: hypothetical protein VGE52_02505, partial [Pirellulales bacterium]
MPELTLPPINDAWEAGMLAAAVVALGSVWLIRELRNRLSRGQLVTLLFLRVLSILVLLFAMLRPALVYTDVKKLPATLVVLADSSRSMQIKDMAGDRSRWAAMVAELEPNLPRLQSISEELDVQLLLFDSEVHHVDLDSGNPPFPSEPVGEQTALGKALNAVLQLGARTRLAAVVLLSDGAQRAVRDDPPEAPASQLAGEGVRLFTFAFGESRGLGQVRDVAVKDLLVNPTVFVKNILNVQGTVRIDGYVNKQVEVELLFETPSHKMEVVETKLIEATGDGLLVPVEMSYIPETPGEFKVTLRVKPQPGELVLTNNEASTFVTVLKGGVNVLYVEGQPRNEQKWLRWSLGASQNIHVEFVEVDATKEKPLPPEAATWFQPGKYDVYLLGDVDSAAFGEAQIKALDEAVRERGAGLMMMGGLHSFGPGGWRFLGVQPPEERQTNPGEAAQYLGLLPIAMLRSERQGFKDERVAADLHLVGEQRATIAKPAPGRPLKWLSVVQLGSSIESATAWSKLPALEGANRFRGVTAGAETLLATPDGKPLLVVDEVKNGRVVAFAGDSTWRWWMKGYHVEHRRFWRQLILWLAKKDITSENGVWIKLAERRYQAGDRVELSAGAQTPEGDPIADAVFEG